MGIEKNRSFSSISLKQKSGRPHPSTLGNQVLQASRSYHKPNPLPPAPAGGDRTIERGPFAKHLYI